MAEGLDPDVLAEALRALHRQADGEARARWDRSLPLEDLVLDRWERAASLGFGEGSSIYASALVYGDVSVGEHTWIGPHALLDGSGGGLRIGSWCSISAGVHLYTHDTVLRSLSGGALPRATAPASVGDRCHVGAGAVIAAGTSIGAGCVVGAGSFVKGRVPDATVVAGSPARPIGIVEGEGAQVVVRTDPEARAEAVRRTEGAGGGGS